MYTNKYIVANYNTRATASGSVVEQTVSIEPMVNTYYTWLVVGVTSSYPHYSDRGPTLNVNIRKNTDLTGGYSGTSAGVGAIATTLAINLGSEPSTAKSFAYDITNWSFSSMAIGHSLAEGVAGATARAHYSIIAFSKGW